MRRLECHRGQSDLSLRKDSEHWVEFSGSIRRVESSIRGARSFRLGRVPAEFSTATAPRAAPSWGAAFFRRLVLTLKHQFRPVGVKNQIV